MIARRWWASPTRCALAACTLAVCAPAAPADAQQAPANASAAAAQTGIWALLGGGYTAVRRGCQTCVEAGPSRRTGSVVAEVGYAVDRRTSVGAEVFWIPVDTAAGWRSTTHVDAMAWFTPWLTRGFFIKGGAGMAFVRNALDGLEDQPTTSKALSLVLGAGWTMRRERRVSFQVFGSQHAAALGDLQTAGGQVNDVLTNFWSAGVAIAVRR